MEFMNLINDYAAYILLGMAGLHLILFIIILVNVVQNHKLKKKYKQFLLGKDGSSLEDNLIQRVNEIEG